MTHAPRSAPISYRPPKEREAALRTRIAASGLSANAFITEALFGRTRHRPSELRLLAQLLAQCTAISDRLAGNGDDAPLPAGVHAELRDIRAALLTLMGRTP